MKNLIAAVLLLGCGAVQAIPITWTINNASLGEYGPVVGQFDFDVDTLLYSNVSIVAGGLPGVGSSNFTDVHLPNSPNGNQLLVMGSTVYLGNGPWESSLFLNFGSSLTSVGGVVSISSGSVWVPDPGFSMILDPGASVSAVPIPTSVWLFGSALAGLGWIRRKQAA
jgi:hypothetical protein